MLKNQAKIPSEYRRVCYTKDCTFTTFHDCKPSNGPWQTGDFGKVDQPLGQLRCKVDWDMDMVDEDREDSRPHWSTKQIV